MLGQGLRLAGFGVVLGLAGAFALTRLISGMLHGVSATDPVTYLAVPVLLVVVAALACLLPARKATAVDPTLALAAE